MSVLIRRSDAIAIIQNADYKYPTWPHIVEAKEGMVQAIKSAPAISAWNRRADARQHALKTGDCPMCEDCPDGCPVETPKDSRNIITNADRIRSMSDEELARQNDGGDGMNKITTQDAINELLRMKKHLLGPQGCSAQSQQVNEYKAKCISMAINALCAQRERRKP